MVPGFLIAAVLAILATGMALAHRRAWRSEVRSEPEDAQRTFARAQFRRRMQAAGMIFALAVLIATGQFIDDPLVSIFFWLGVAAVAVWIGGLGIIDMSASKRHYGREVRTNIQEQAKLWAEVRRLQDEHRDEGNGKH